MRYLLDGMDVKKNNNNYVKNNTYVKQRLRLTLDCTIIEKIPKTQQILARKHFQQQGLILTTMLNL